MQVLHGQQLTKRYVSVDLLLLWRATSLSDEEYVSKRVTINKVPNYVVLHQAHGKLLQQCSGMLMTHSTGLTIPELEGDSEPC